MKKLTNEQLKQESAQQIAALKNLSLWLIQLLMLTIVLVIPAWWGLHGTDLRFVAGVICTVLAVVGILLGVILSYGIFRGSRNVYKLNDAANTD